MPRDYEAWCEWLYNKLREAGIPATREGGVERGFLRRYDDPQSWSHTFYEWFPSEYVERAD